MVKLNYRKYAFVSNYREYNMLWLEYEVFLQISLAKTKYQQIPDILR